jgi:glucan 1,3-beta-glucosidase
MADLARRVKSETGLPVTYADVTDFWLTAPPLLADAVDFITIHILPYWEDHPASAEGGLAVVESAVAQVQALFPGKPVFIGETGFPSRGRERQSAVPSLVSEARYLRGFMAYAARAGVDYNLIEAFDQPWKRLLEGTAGGYWGMYDSARAPKFPWRGAVSNHPDWPVEAGASFVVALLALVAWVASGLIANWRRAAFFGVAAGAGGVLLVLQAEHSWAAWRAIPELMIEALLFVQSCAALLLLPPAVAARPGEIDPFSHCLAWLRRPHLPVDRVLGLGLLRFTVSVTALVVSLGLAFDPRYRDFPNAAFALPALAFAAIALKRGDAFRPAPLWREEAALAALFVLSAAIILVNETPLNLAADLWCAIVGLLILPLAGALRTLPVNLGRAATT